MPGCQPSEPCLPPTKLPEEQTAGSRGLWATARESLLFSRAPGCSPLLERRVRVQILPRHSAAAPEKPRAALLLMALRGSPGGAVGRRHPADLSSAPPLSATIERLSQF